MWLVLGSDLKGPGMRLQEPTSTVRGCAASSLGPSRPQSQCSIKSDILMSCFPLNPSTNSLGFFNVFLSFIHCLSPKPIFRVIKIHKHTTKTTKHNTELPLNYFPTRAIWLNRWSQKRETCQLQAPAWDCTWKMLYVRSGACRRATSLIWATVTSSLE